MIMATTNMNEYCNRYVEGWDDHDPEAVMAAFAPGGTVTAPPFDEPRTGTEIGKWVVETVRGFPDVHFGDHDLLSTDVEGVFVLEWTLHGTHTGPFNGLPPTGNTVELEGVDVFTVSEDGIEFLRVYFDQSSMAEQLGLTFPAIVGQLPTLARGAIRNIL